MLVTDPIQHLGASNKGGVQEPYGEAMPVAIPIRCKPDGDLVKSIRVCDEMWRPPQVLRGGLTLAGCGGVGTGHRPVGAHGTQVPPILVLDRTGERPPRKWWTQPDPTFQRCCVLVRG